VKPREPTLPIIRPDCKRTMDVAITKLQQNVAVICVGCRKSIGVTSEFRESIQGIK